MRKSETMERALTAVSIERRAQIEQWGDQSGHPDTTWLAILTEEVGEAAQAVLHDKFGGKAAGELRWELIQVAAVAVAWIEAIDKRGLK
jgi:NTP pyrophosphatase (non-canonical NTP hydrolase)